MSTNLKVTEDQLNLLKTGTVIHTKNNGWNEIFYYWFKVIDNNTLEIIFPEHLPDNLKEQINKLRND